MGGCCPDVRMPSGKISRGASLFFTLTEEAGMCDDSSMRAPGAILTGVLLCGWGLVYVSLDE